MAFVASYLLRKEMQEREERRVTRERQRSRALSQLEINDRETWIDIVRAEERLEEETAAQIQSREEGHQSIHMLNVVVVDEPEEDDRGERDQGQGDEGCSPSRSPSFSTEAEEGELECRICQELDLESRLESPCSCSGTLKYVHKRCLQKWINEKGNITCEICRSPLNGDFTVPTPRRVARIEEPSPAAFVGWLIPGYSRAAQEAEAQAEEGQTMFQRFWSKGHNRFLCKFCLLLTIMNVVIGVSTSETTIFEAFVYTFRILVIFVPIFIVTYALRGFLKFYRHSHDEREPTILLIT
ncbi:RING-CH-type domain-containing protein [Chloropicon primus]|uniref:Uncharacterized protein n=1 Tax=Chloropicon primus TaxID=1764295 RepID=A0A5B8MG29_9CHLO|nr:hypothetical protein A3770_03p21360 [Chloropicon primus]UPQ98830.1 RING-CH-type domain-containing protein [Chloropicon primus]|eukprot:QDZ19618.1 hypothetical protein A3770_03p21360 [Chloropicon primus]